VSTRPAYVAAPGDVNMQPVADPCYARVMRFRRLSLGFALALALPRLAVAAKVGVTTITFTKTSVTTSEPRPLATVIWYPAVGKTGTPEAFGLRDAKVKRGRFPLVVFSHGSCGRPTEATYFTMALAKAGFVVAAPPHVGNTTDDPMCFTQAVFLDSAANRVPDVRFVIDSMLGLAADSSSPFARRLRTDRIAVSGLSFGGFTTLLTEQQDERVRAAFALVPGGTAFLEADPIAQPTLVIGAEDDHVVTWPESVKAYAKLAGPRFLVELLGGDHLNAVDECPGFCGTITQEEAHERILHYALPFFRRYVQGKRVPERVLTRPIDGVVVQAEP
jgi:predicted dienelactone hydrolase